MIDTEALERLALRLELARRRQVEILAADEGAGLPDLRQLDTLASLETALASVRRQLETLG